MDHTSRGRLRPLALLLSVAVLVGSAFAGPADAAPDAKAASATSAWLAKQLTADGTLQNPLGGALPDHGLMIDTLFALFASGDGKLGKPIADYLDGHATDYYTWDALVPGQGYDAIITAGSVAKVLVAAEVAGRDPHTFGGHDLVAEVEGTIMREGRDKGRSSDYSKNPDLADLVSNNSNVFGQALAVIGLAGAHANDQLAIDTLVSQQCGEGYFRIFFGYTGDPDHPRLSTCDEGKADDQGAPDGDATGLALSALLSARAAGATGLDEPIRRTVTWLKAHQSAGGGWGGGVSTEAPNTNSTGLIVQALAQAGGADDAVAKGTAYLKSAEVTSADAGTALAGDVGAIAYTPEQYRQARTDGVSGVDTWIRASAQASLGLSQHGFWALTQGAVPQHDGTKPGSTPKPAKPHPKPPAHQQHAGDPAPPPHSGGGTPVTPKKVTAEPGSATPKGKVGRYLAAHLVDGDHVEVTQGGKTYVDYDATADLVFALRTLGEQPAATTRASAFLLDPKSIAAYAHGAPYEKEAAYAEPLAKLVVLARFGQAAPGAPKTLDATVTSLDSDLAALRGPDGAFTDHGKYPDTADGTERQAWATLATTADPAAGLGALQAADRLVARQCADGLFPLADSKCGTGDPAATAFALTALNAQPRVPTVDGARAVRTPAGDVVPPAWPSRRADALGTASAALGRKLDAQGLARTATGAVDVRTTALVAGGQQAVGVDTTATTRGLAPFVRPDGGVAKTTGGTSELALTIAAAPGIAGASWTSAKDSPVNPAVRLPLPAKPQPQAVPKAHEDTPARSPWTVVALVLLGLALVGALWIGVHTFTHRNKTTKAVAP